MEKREGGMEKREGGMDEKEVGVCSGDIQTSKSTGLNYENKGKEKILCGDSEGGDNDEARRPWCTGSVNHFGFMEDSISGLPNFRNIQAMMEESQNSMDDGSSLWLKQSTQVGVSVEEIMEAVNYGSGRRGGRKRMRVGSRKVGSKRRRLSAKVTRSLGEATILYTKGCHEDAASVLKKVVVLAPNVQAPYHMLGLVYAAMGENTKALNCYMLAAHLKPKDPCLWKLLVTLSAEQGNTGQARYCLRKAITADPEDTSLISLHASLYVDLKDYRKAAGLYEKVLEDFPNDVQVIAAMSDLYVKSDQPEKAITILEDFLLPRPYIHNMLPALDLLISVCVNCCQFEKALSHLDRVRSDLLPLGDELPLHLRIKEGICYIRLGDSVKAEHILSTLLFLENALEYAHLVIQVGDSNSALGRHELALKYYLMLEKDDAWDMLDICSSLYAKIAECYLCLKEIEKATLYMYKVLRVSGEDVGCRLRLASLLVDQGKDDVAITLLSPPGNSQLHNGCGKQWWSDGEIRLMLARIYKAKGDSLNFVAVIFNALRDSLAIERRQRLIRGKETRRLRIRKIVLRERAKLLDEGDSIFQGFKPVACSSDLSKALRARAILKKKEEKRISDSSESEEPVGETMMEPPIPKIFSDGQKRGDLIVEVCEALESIEKNDEALEIISLALRLYLDERLVSIGSRIVSHTRPEVGFEFSKCVVEKEPHNVAAWNSYYGMVSKIDFRFHRHCKFLHRMKVLHKDCVPPILISGHQLTMISQHQAAAREYLEAYRLLPSSSLVNLCVGWNSFDKPGIGF